jgi:hypothetical protein
MFRRSIFVPLALAVLVQLAAAAAPQWPSFTGPSGTFGSYDKFSAQPFLAGPQKPVVQSSSSLSGIYNPGGVVIDSAGNAYATVDAWIMVYKASSGLIYNTSLDANLNIESVSTPLITSDGALLIVQVFNNSGDPAVYGFVALNITKLLTGLSAADPSTAAANAVAWTSYNPNLVYSDNPQGWTINQLASGHLAVADMGYWVSTIDATTGTVMLNVNTSAYQPVNTTTQSHAYDEAVAVPPPQASSDGTTLFYLRNDGYYFALNASNGALLALTNLNQGWNGSFDASYVYWGETYPILDSKNNSYIFVYCDGYPESYFLVSLSFSKNSFTPRWHTLFSSGDNIQLQTPLLLNDSVIVLLDSANGPRSYSTATGALLWASQVLTGPSNVLSLTFDSATQPVYNPTSQILYVASSDEGCALAAYSFATDSLLWAVSFSAGPVNISSCESFSYSNLAIDSAGNIHAITNGYVDTSVYAVFGCNSGSLLNTGLCTGQTLAPGGASNPPPVGFHPAPAQSYVIFTASFTGTSTCDPGNNYANVYSGALGFALPYPAVSYTTGVCNDTSINQFAQSSIAFSYSGAGSGGMLQKWTYTTPNCTGTATITNVTTSCTDNSATNGFPSSSQTIAAPYNGLSSLSSSLTGYLTVLLNGGKVQSGTFVAASVCLRVPQTPYTKWNSTKVTCNGASSAATPTYYSDNACATPFVFPPTSPTPIPPTPPVAPSPYSTVYYCSASGGPPPSPPTAPTSSGNPANPAAPGSSGNPANPTAPGSSGNPANPVTPSNATNPSSPSGSTPTPTGANSDAAGVVASLLLVALTVVLTVGLRN